jgi:hypothetical protein
MRVASLSLYPSYSAIQIGPVERYEECSEERIFILADFMFYVNWRQHERVLAGAELRSKKWPLA